jgi:2-polyprenyl-3-methyl-5-hydroxy-6-metoxy-1,4-benzoquinol methylase
MDRMPDPLSDEKVIDSWRKNSAPWTEAVRAHQIESRRLVTDAAIVDAVVSRAPRTALDIGCGEGWLARALTERGIATTGVDVVPELVAQASKSGGGDFRVMSYEDIAAGKLDLTVDLAVANFALIGGGTVDALIKRIPALLVPRGSLVIQTLHPVVAAGDQPYEDGWRRGSWAGFSAAFTDPAPWYFRTLGSWVALLETSGLRLVDVREPLHPGTGRPASIIFIAQASG